MLCKFKLGTAVKKHQEREYKLVKILGAWGAYTLEIWKSEGGHSEGCEEAEENPGKMGDYGAV